MKATETHEQVSRAYDRVLRKSQSQQTGSSCCGTPSAKSAFTARTYGEAAAAHDVAAASSFGCGNPLALAEIEPGQTVLDLGSGAGLDLLIAAERVGPTGRVIGIDMTDSMIEAAAANAARAGYADVVEVRKGLIEELPVETGSVDWVISNCVINLSPDKARVFGEIARVLRPGGRFSISDIVVEDMPEWIRENAAAHAACIAGAISADEYLAGLGAAGLVDVEVADRMVYDAAQLRALVGEEFSSLGLDAALLDAGLHAVDGKVASARFTGRRSSDT